MARFSALAAIATTVALAAAPLQAQSPVAGYVTFRGDISVNGTLKSGSLEAAIGPYKGDLNFGSALTLENAVIWCVDWQHFAPSRGYADSYYLSTLALGADLSKTRKNDFARYLKAAWMFEQVDPNGGMFNLTGTRYSAKNVQGSAWEMMDPSAFGPSGNADGANIGLVDNLNYDKYRYFNVSGDAANKTLANLRYDWYILSDKGSGTVNQEFMVGVARVPEPGTLALVVTGLGMLGTVARRRRQR